MKYPCKDCNKREIGCHAKCNDPDYLEYRQELEDIKKAKAKERLIRNCRYDSVSKTLEQSRKRTTKLGGFYKNDKTEQY